MRLECSKWLGWLTLQGICRAVKWYVKNNCRFLEPNLYTCCVQMLLLSIELAPTLENHSSIRLLNLRIWVLSADEGSLTHLLHNSRNRSVSPRHHQPQQLAPND